MNKDKLESLFISGDITIKEAIKKLSETAEHILLFVDHQKKLIGVINDGDIRRSIISGSQLTASAKDIMRTDFISVNKNCRDLFQTAKELIQKYRIDKVPIINDEGLLEDVIGWSDYLEGEGKELEREYFPQYRVVIMAGGKGTRLDPFTKIIPKPLIPINDKPIIEHIMDRYHSMGFNEFVILINYKKEMIKLYFAESMLPYNIEFIEEHDYYGTAGGLHLLKDRIKDTFVVVNCDTILESDYRSILHWHKEKKYLITIVGAHKEIAVPFGVLKMDNGTLIDIDEKPNYDIFVNTGTYFLEFLLYLNLYYRSHKG
ncbi:MAG: NTP transferase domain-containing protein [Syntrophales bacterium LBB04]|nr:NTP transferase domain-containing protein [Syntrophales bacterium LBB04]